MSSFKGNTSLLENSAGILYDKFITVQAAAEVTGYCSQYLRRLLRNRKLEGAKVGQVWLIKIASLGAHLKITEATGDHRYGPRKAQINKSSTSVNGSRIQMYTPGDLEEYDERYDIGCRQHSIIKAKIARRERGEIAFPHSLKQLTEAEYSSVISRTGVGGPPSGYLRINDVPYVVGENAERHGVHVQRTGAARYTRDYYGIFAAAALARLYERGGEIMIFGSQAPRDVNFRQDLMKAVVGDWHIETNSSERHFRVIYANTFDEPVGGLMNVLLTEDGQHYQQSDLNGGRSLVIDIGGFTTDYIAVNPGGEVDYSLARSVPI